MNTLDNEQEEFIKSVLNSLKLAGEYQAGLLKALEIGGKNQQEGIAFVQYLSKYIEASLAMSLQFAILYTHGADQIAKEGMKKIRKN